jgi:hypothetical protein
MSTASAVMDALETMVGATSFMGATNVGRDYNVLESVSGSAAVIEPFGLEQYETDFDHDHQSDWGISIRFFSKDTGDPAGIGARTACMMDLVAGTIRANPELQGTVNRSRLTLERDLPPDGFVVAGGATWQECAARLVVEIWPDG